MMATAYEWHNYGKSTIGNRADIERVPIENLRRFYKKYYQPDNTIVTIAGQFDPEQALALVEKYFGPIPRPERGSSGSCRERDGRSGFRSRRSTRQCCRIRSRSSRRQRSRLPASLPCER